MEVHLEEGQMQGENTHIWRQTYMCQGPAQSPQKGSAFEADEKVVESSVEAQRCQSPFGASTEPLR